MAEGPIPITAIRAVAAGYGMDGDEADSFEEIISGMDAAYMEYRQAEMESRSKK